MRRGHPAIELEAETQEVLAALCARIAVNVRRHRQARGWTQETCAERCALERTHFQAIEACRHNATVATLARLSRGLELDIMRLVAPAPPFAPHPTGRPRKCAASETRVPELHTLAEFDRDRASRG